MPKLVRKLLLTITVILLAITAVLLVLTFWPKDDQPPAQEKKTPMAGVSIPLPEGWQTKSEPGVAYAFKPPCASLACAGIAVFDGQAFKSVDRKKAIVGRYTCTSNKKEKAGALTQKDTPLFGSGEAQVGAIRYTIPLCGVSNSEMLDIWEVRLPERYVVAPVDPLRRLPEITARLNRATW